MLRLISSSDAGTGMRPALLSMTILTSAIPSAGRAGVPAKITSLICGPRRARGPCSPSTQAMASTTFDLPDPLGPTITLMPGRNSSVVLSPKDLNPRSVSDLRNTVGPRCYPGTAADPGKRSPKNYSAVIPAPGGGTGDRVLGWVASEAAAR